jgi:hypothetical protein
MKPIVERKELDNVNPRPLSANGITAHSPYSCVIGCCRILHILQTDRVLVEGVLVGTLVRALGSLLRCQLLCIGIRMTGRHLHVREIGGNEILFSISTLNRLFLIFSIDPSAIT